MNQPNEPTESEIRAEAGRIWLAAGGGITSQWIEQQNWWTAHGTLWRRWRYQGRVFNEVNA